MLLNVPIPPPQQPAREKVPEPDQAALPKLFTVRASPSCTKLPGKILKSALRAISVLPVPCHTPPDRFAATFVTVSTPLPAKVPLLWLRVLMEAVGLSN